MFARNSQAQIKYLNFASVAIRSIKMNAYNCDLRNNSCIKMLF